MIVTMMLLLGMNQIMDAFRDVDVDYGCLLMLMLIMGAC
jgi:hypothetical protein